VLYRETSLAGVRLIELQPACDDRGFFSRTFCVREFAAEGLCTTFVQHSMSRTLRQGSIRGMHFQKGAAAEVKVVSCIRGALYDVIVDLRPGSPTLGRWEGFELTAENRARLYIPAGFAHGFQTLEDNTEASYLISEFYAPDAASGIRFDDPQLAIRWPLPVTVVSERDRSWPGYDALGL
jgi:dTDP-4-dehydrorhamnose 3,5-epimerase